MTVYNTHVSLFYIISALICCFDIKLTITIFVLGRCIGTLRGHDDEVLDVAFDYTGQMLLTASADGTARCYNAVSHNLISKFEGHEGEISKVKNKKQFSVITVSKYIYVRFFYCLLISHITGKDNPVVEIFINLVTYCRSHLTPKEPRC